MIDALCVANWNVDLVSRVARPIARGETLLARSLDYARPYTVASS